MDDFYKFITLVLLAFTAIGAPLALYAGADIIDILWFIGKTFLCFIAFVYLKKLYHQIAGEIYIIRKYGWKDYWNE